MLWLKWIYLKLRLLYPKIFCSYVFVKCKGADANSFVSFLPIYKLNRNAPQMEDFAGITDEQLEKIKQKVIKEQIFRASAREGWHALPPEIQMFILKDIRKQLILNKAPPVLYKNNLKRIYLKLRLLYPKIFCSSASVKCKGADANSFVSCLSSS